MDYDQKKEKLKEYIAALGRLERKCEEVARWSSMAEDSEPDSSNMIKTTAMQVRQECEALSEQVNRLRGQLTQALERMPTEKRREILELYYLNGMTTTQICRKKEWSKRYVLKIHSEAIKEFDEVSGLTEHLLAGGEQISPFM